MDARSYREAAGIVKKRAALAGPRISAGAARIA
jgi:hypothetical protein